MKGKLRRNDINYGINSAISSKIKKIGKYRKYNSHKETIRNY